MPAGDLVNMRVRMYHDFNWVAEINLGFVLKTDSDTVLQELADEWFGTIGNIWVAPLSNEVIVKELRIERFGPEVTDPFNAEPPIELRGQQSEPSAPHSCAALIRWTTGLQGIGGRGRSYLYGMRRDEIQSGQFWGELTKEAMTNIGNAMLLRFGPTGFSPTAQFVIINRRRDNAPLVPYGSTPINGFVVVELLASQRRRIYNVPE